MTAAEGKVPGVHTLEHAYAAVAEAAAVSARVEKSMPPFFEGSLTARAAPLWRS